MEMLDYIAGEEETVDADGNIKDEPAEAKKPRRKRTVFPIEKVNRLELYFKENVPPLVFSQAFEVMIEVTCRFDPVYFVDFFQANFFSGEKENCLISSLALGK